MVVTSETEEQRRRREQLRSLFDGIAGPYDASRQGYPAEIVDAVCGTSRIGPGVYVLEIGCGTGQLTRQLAGRAFSLTAIDIGAKMIEAARRMVSESQQVGELGGGGIAADIVGVYDFTATVPSGAGR